MGMNFDAVGWAHWLYQDRFASAGAWQAVPASGSSIGLPASSMDSDYWPTSAPAGYTYVAHPLVKTVNSTDSYDIFWTGNLTPVSKTGITISAVDQANKTCVATPDPSVWATGVPMFFHYSIDPADTAAGTYPGGPNALDAQGNPARAAGKRGVVAIPHGAAVTKFDSAVQAQLSAVLGTGPIRFLKMTGAEANAGVNTAWNGGTQAAPNYAITMANRGSITSGVWSSVDGAIAGNPSCNPGGVPIEIAVEICNLLNRDLWWNECWNSHPDVVQYNAAYIRDNLNSTLRAFIEIANEIWNATYLVTGQAGLESQAAHRTSGTGISVGGFSFGDRAARVAEKAYEVFGYYSAAFAAASSQPGGVKPSLKRVFAWWHTQGAIIAQEILDYIPPNSTIPVKQFVDCYATSIYFATNNVDPSTGVPFIYDESRGEGPLLTNIYYDIENQCENAIAIRSICDARNIEYVHYEAADAEYLSNSTTTDATVAATLTRDPAVGIWLNYAFSRLENANPGGVTNYFAFIGSINPKQGTFGTLEYMLQDPAGTPPAPKYTALQRFLAGNRDLVPLSGNLLASVGAQVGDIVGYVYRRSPGSTVSVASPFAVNDTGQSVIPVTVADASAFATAGTLSAVFSETGGNPTATNPTTLSCQVLSGTFWTPKRSNKSMVYEDSNGINDTTGRSCRNVIWDASDVVAIANTLRSNGYFEFTANLGTTSAAKVGIVGPAFTSSTNMYWSNSSVCWNNDGGGTVVRNGTVLATWGTWTKNDQLDLFLSASGKLYGRKNNGSWLGATGAGTVDPNTDTGGVDVSALLTTTGGTVSPACHTQKAGFGGTARFADADFIHTKPTGASAWV